VADRDPELNKAVSELASAILRAGALKGEAHFNVGVELERQLKQFADALLHEANNDGDPDKPG
jgi:hypothetical protein